MKAALATEVRAGDQTVSLDKKNLDINTIHNFLTNSYWAKGITKEKVKKCIDNSICFGMYDSGKLIGFARVVTDFCRFAYLMDVFIIDSYRKQGLSVKLLKEIFSHPDLKKVSRWMLATTQLRVVDSYRSHQHVIEPPCVPPLGRL